MDTFEQSQSDSDKDPREEEGLEIKERNSIVDLDIMGQLDSSKLVEIKRDFCRWEDQSLNKNEFITIMMHHLPEISDKVRLVGSLNELFEQIDVNFDQQLEWHEFSNYIIEKGMIKKDRTFIDAIKNYSQLHWVDKIKHKGEIENVTFIYPLRHLIVMENGVKEFKVYDLKTMRLFKEVSGHRGSVLAATHAASVNSVITSSNDLTILVWDESQYYLKQRLSCPVFQLALAWSGLHSTLYSGGTDAVIYTWDIETGWEKSRIAMSGDTFEAKMGHKNVIMALLAIDSSNMLVSGDADGDIYIWDTPQNTKRIKLNGQNKEVYSLDWHPHHGILISAGLDREAYGWNPLVKNHIFKLSGHNYSLVGVRCMPDTYQIITADISGVIKLWDIRTVTCVQTLNVASSQITCFTVGFPEKMIITGAKYLNVFVYDEPRDQYLVDENPSIFTVFNSLFNFFITVHSGVVKIWDERGHLLHIFRELSKDDICAATLDGRKRKLFIADASGHIVAINVKNGTRVKKFYRHDDEVTGLVYSDEHRALISSSWDRRVKVHDDSKSDIKASVKFDRPQQSESINCITAHFGTSLMASAGEEGVIHFNKFTSSRQETSIDTGSEVRQLLFLNPSHVLVSCDAEGSLSFWYAESNRIFQKSFYSFVNEGNNTVSPISALDFEPSSEQLLTGDEHGCFKVYSIGALLKKACTMYGKQKDSPAKKIFITTNECINNPIGPQDISLNIEVQAHRDKITHISNERDSGLILTSGFDCAVHVWNFSGERIGSFMLGGCPYWRVVTCNEDRIREDRERAELLLKKIEETSYEELILRQKEKFSGNEDEIDDYQELDLDGYDKPKLKVTKSENIFKQYGFSFTAEGRIEHKQNFVEAQEEIKVNAKSGLQRAALSTVSLLTKKPI